MPATETLYAVDIRLKEGGAAASPHDIIDSNHPLKQAATALGKIEQTVSKPGSIFSSMSGLGAAGMSGIGAAIAVGVAGAVAAWMIPRAILQDQFNKMDAAGMKLQDEMKKTQDLLNSPQVKSDMASFKTEDSYNKAFKPITGLANAEQELNDILKDGVQNQEEFNRLLEIRDFLEESRLKNQTESNRLQDEEGIVSSKVVDQRGKILDLILRSNEAKKTFNMITQSNIANVEAETNSLQKQLSTLQAIARYKEPSGLINADVYRDGQLLGNYSGQTFDAAQSKMLGYGNQATFVGIKPMTDAEFYAQHPSARQS